MVSKGNVFMPFHFGYWDNKDGRATAANELTIDRWDPVSKQPMFKSGAVRIEKIPADAAGLPYVREPHTAAINDASRKPDVATSTTDKDKAQLERQMELWLGETYETTVQLLEIYEKLIPQLIHHDQEVEGGLRMLHKLADEMKACLEPHVQRLGENKQRGRHRAHILRQALFPDPEHDPDSPSIAYEVLETLQGLAVYLSHIQSSLTALEPVALAMWDDPFNHAVKQAQQSVHRMMAWVKQQIKVRSPQTLLVPIPRPRTGGR